MTTPEQAEGNLRLSELAAAFPAESGVVEGRMFNGCGLSVDGRFFAFVSRDGSLVLKLPEQAIHELVQAGVGTPKTMGVRVMREWVTVVDPGQWQPLAQQAWLFVR